MVNAGMTDALPIELSNGPVLSRTAASELRATIMRRWSCSASLLQTVPVQAPLDSQRTWNVVVHIFSLHGCDKANLAYAWSSMVDGGDQPRLFSALHIGPLNSPMCAVQAAIADELRLFRLTKTRAWPHAAMNGRLFQAPVFSRAM